MIDTATMIAIGIAAMLATAGITTFITRKRMARDAFSLALALRAKSPGLSDTGTAIVNLLTEYGMVKLQRDPDHDLDIMILRTWLARKSYAELEHTYKYLQRGLRTMDPPNRPDSA